MRRKLDELAEKEFDLVIIGGGIYGAAAAWDGVLRGLKVALIEQGDFASATSSNSLKIIHGGLRYIQHADVKRMRESIRERRILMTIAPHLVHPLPCIMPLYGHFGKGPEAMRVALLLNDLVGFDRNRIDDPQKILPPGRVLPAREVEEKLPGIRRTKLTGGALWYDCFVYNSERLLINYLYSAASKGAVMANYVRAEDLIQRQNRIIGVQARDLESDTRFPIYGKILLNTTGPWVNQVFRWLRRGPERKPVKLSRAMNLVTRPIFSDFAAGIQGRRLVRINSRTVDRSGKVYFTVPWRNVSLVGTLHDPYDGEPDRFMVREGDIDFFLQNINSALPERPLSRKDVFFVYAGLLPMDGPDEKTGEVVLTKHYKLIDHQKEDGIDGLISVVGVKYTTARDVAVKAVNLALQKMGEKPPPTQTETQRLLGGEIDRFEDFRHQTYQALHDRFPKEVTEQLIKNYGTRLSEILKLGEKDSSLLNPLPSSTVLAAEIVYAVRHEMALHLVDVVLRRTELGSAGQPTDAALQMSAKLMAQELGWDTATRQAEIERVKAMYRFE